MNEKLLEHYENIFGIKKERVQELINELAKDIIERVLREEIDIEYAVESIYQIGKTEDERLFLAYFFGGIRQTVFATDMMKMLADTLIKKNIALFTENMSFYTQLTDAIWNELSNYLGVPDFEQIAEKDRNILEKAFLANEKMNELMKKLAKGGGEKDDKEQK